MVDFYRMNHIKHVVETDYDVRARLEVESEAKCVLRYLGTMAQILQLPVAAWDCPTTAAGEIDTERNKKMWNNGNGNGQGSGYGQGNGYGQPQQGYAAQGGEDVYGRLNNTKPVGGARFPFLEDTGKYALCTLEEFQHSSAGPSARALFEVLESRGGKHPVGSYVVKIWKLVKPPFKPGMTTDADMFADFCRKLKGAPDSYAIGNDIRVLMKERPRDQLARGTVIEANAVPNQKGTWINIYWKAIQQSPQDIAQMRQRLEAKGIPSTDPNVQQAPPPQQGYTPPPQQGYQQQPQPQAAPYGYGPNGPPTQGYPQQPSPSPQQQPQQGPPPGGYLANVPPQNGQGGGQGNQGGSW